MCDDDEIEDETHFLFRCKRHEELRDLLYTVVQPYFPNFESLSDKEKFGILMSTDYVKYTAEFLYKSSICIIRSEKEQTTSVWC